MTEEKNQPTPDPETERVEQEQTETAQPTAESTVEKPASTETPETDMTPDDAVQDAPVDSQELPDGERHASEAIQSSDESPEPVATAEPKTEAPDLSVAEQPPEADPTPEAEAADTDQPQLLLEAELQPAASESAADKEDDASKQSKKDSKKEKAERIKANKKRRQNMAQYNLMVSHFAACGRCSYFLAGYRVIHGVENLETAVFNSKAGWLILSWNHDMRKLLTKSYGIELYADTYHFDGCCLECGRHYTFQAGDKPEADSTLRVQMNTRRR